MSVAIKVCGLRRKADVDLCVSLGVDWLGFNFWPQSKRHVDVTTAAALIRALPAHVRAVGVFVNASPAEVKETIAATGISEVQLHGDERLVDYATLATPLIQVVRVHSRETLAATSPSPHATQVLLDAAVPGFGGAGVSFDWTLATEAQTAWSRRVLLAGGLTPSNVGEAIRRVRPLGVDVASGVEAAPGEKSPEKLRAFVEAVRAADEEHGR